MPQLWLLPCLWWEINFSVNRTIKWSINIGSDLFLKNWLWPESLMHIGKWRFFFQNYLFSLYKIFPVNQCALSSSWQNPAIPMQKLQDIQRAMELLSACQGPAKNIDEATKRKYQFWDTQPVPKLSKSLSRPGYKNCTWKNICGSSLSFSSWIKLRWQQLLNFSGKLPLLSAVIFLK